MDRSIWLTVEEYAHMSANAAMTEAFLRAESSDTVRTRIYTGKPARLQIVGRMNQVRSVADVMADLVGEFEETVSRLDAIRDS